MLYKEWNRIFEENEEGGIGDVIEQKVIIRFCMEIDALPYLQREIILACLQGKKLADIASKLSLTEGEVRIEKYKAYLHLRKSLSDGFGLVLLQFLF